MASILDVITLDSIYPGLEVPKGEIRKINKHIKNRTLASKYKPQILKRREKNTKKTKK